MLKYCYQHCIKIKASLALLIAIITIQSCGTSGLRQDAASLPKTTNYERPSIAIEETLKENTLGLNAVKEAKIRDVQATTPRTGISIPDVNMTTYYVHEIIGMDIGAISSLLGKPSLTRKEKSVRILQYSVKECVLDIYLYEDGSTYKELKVKYYEMRNANGEILIDNNCFMNVVSAHYKSSQKVLDRPS